MNRKIITNNVEETRKLGSEFAKVLSAGETALLYGDLGAGKTTFVQGLAAGLGISDRILSPTFVLHRIHDVNSSKIKTLNHIDLYRIEDPTDLKSLGLEEIVNEMESVALIEWADRLSDLKLKKAYKIWFENLGDDKRKIKIEKYE